MCLYFGPAAAKPILGAQIMIPTTSPLYCKYINISGLQKLFCKFLAFPVFSDVFPMPTSAIVVSSPNCYNHQKAFFHARCTFLLILDTYVFHACKIHI